MRTRTVVLVAAAIGLGLALPSSLSAARSPYSAVDPKNTPAKVDIRKYRVKYDGAVRLDVWLRKGTNPLSDPEWVDRLTGVLWHIKVPGGQAIDYAAFFYNGGPDVLDGEVDLYDPPLYEMKVCDTTETFLEPNQYRLEFPATCIGSPDYIRTQTLMVLDKDPYNMTGFEDKFDIAPDVGFSPKVKPAI